MVCDMAARSTGSACAGRRWPTSVIEGFSTVYSYGIAMPPGALTGLDGEPP